MKEDLKKLPKEINLQIYNVMLKSRLLEERLIKIYRSGDGYFWIGSPGEEAFGVPLGLLSHKGQGLDFDFFHLHYRSTPTLLALGMNPIDSIRLMMNRVTDPSSGGRNFASHYCFPKWNVVPVTSPIGTQYVTALGTSHVQRKRRSKANESSSQRLQPITIVTGGDAGTAEGDFASCLIWSSRPGKELPILITVQNNQWGISTSFRDQHGEVYIADRAKAFQIRSRVIDGNNPVESYLALKEEMDYIRKTGKPSFVEARVSRLYGHSSASGANLAEQEQDCLLTYERALIDEQYINENDVKILRNSLEKEFFNIYQSVKKEEVPVKESIWDHIYSQNENGDWRNF